jgi:hypothetical protein
MSGWLFKALPGVVISNNEGSGALEFAGTAGILWKHLSQRTHPEPKELDLAIRDVLQEHDIELVLLVGYMRLIGPLTLKAYEGRILNIHPALLRYGPTGREPPSWRPSPGSGTSHSRGDNATCAYRRGVYKGQPASKPQMAPSRQLDQWTPDRARQPVPDQEVPKPV